MFILCFALGCQSSKKGDSNPQGTGEKSPAAALSSAATLTDLDQLISDLKDKNGWYRTSCASCNPEFVDLYLKGMELHKKREWEESNRDLEKAYSFNSDRAEFLCFYIFLNYFMLQDSKKQKEWWENTVAYDVPSSEFLEGVGKNPIYGGCSEGKELSLTLRWLKIMKNQ